MIGPEQTPVRVSASLSSSARLAQASHRDPESQTRYCLCVGLDLSVSCRLNGRENRFPTSVDHPGIVEKRRSERNLVHDGFDRLSDHRWLVVEHGLKMRPSNWEHQHVVFSVHAFHLELIQEGQDVTGSRMCTRSGCKMTKNLDLVILAGEFCNGELERDVSTT